MVSVDRGMMDGCPSLIQTVAHGWRTSATCSAVGLSRSSSSATSSRPFFLSWRIVSASIVELPVLPVGHHDRGSHHGQADHEHENGDPDHGFLASSALVTRTIWTISSPDLLHMSQTG